MEKQQMLPTVQMDRKTLGGQMVIALSQIMELFDEKNNRYGSDDALMNFWQINIGSQCCITEFMIRNLKRVAWIESCTCLSYSCNIANGWSNPKKIHKIYLNKKTPFAEGALTKRTI